MLVLRRDLKRGLHFPFLFPPTSRPRACSGSLLKIKGFLKKINRKGIDPLKVEYSLLAFSNRDALAFGMNTSDSPAVLYDLYG